MYLMKWEGGYLNEREYKELVELLDQEVTDKKRQLMIIQV